VWLSQSRLVWEIGIRGNLVLIYSALQHCSRALYVHPFTNVRTVHLLSTLYEQYASLNFTFTITVATTLCKAEPSCKHTSNH
jgi:hypothetical protein